MQRCAATANSTKIANPPIIDTDFQVYEYNPSFKIATHVHHCLHVLYAYTPDALFQKTPMHTAAVGNFAYN